jgi:hypothetical protein
MVGMALGWSYGQGTALGASRRFVPQVYGNGGKSEIPAQTEGQGILLIGVGSSVTMGPMHPNKHIREALKYAAERGWRVVMAKGHAYCRIYCGLRHANCQKSVWSTPRNPEHHARDIRDVVDA